MSSAYDIPAAFIQHCYVIKKSQFISRVHHVSSRTQAMACLALAKKDYPDARHHCWAYLLGPPTQPLSQAFNDDGEPSGTAGKPILNVLNHSSFGDVMIIVIRYFGGIKLGAGGLVRAYSNVSTEALDKTEKRLKIKQISCLLCMDFRQEDNCRHFLKQCAGSILKLEYHEQISMQIEISKDQQPAIMEYCSAQSIALTIL